MTVVLLAGSAVPAAEFNGYMADELVRNFQTPPDTVKPWVMLFWNGDFVNKEAITWEMEAYKRVGVNGLQIFPNYEHVSGWGWAFSFEGRSKNRVPPLSDQWYECVRHAIKEADRLGMQLCFHNEPGYSGAGGPWVSVEHSLRLLVKRETDFKGPGKFGKELPAAGGLDYRDVAVLAYRVPELTADVRANTKPRLQSSSAHPKYPLGNAADGNPETFWVSNGERTGEAPSKDKPEWISFEYAEPFVPGAVFVEPRHGFGPRDCQFQSSKDGQSWQTLKSFTMQNIGAAQVEISVTTGRFFRLLITSSYSSANTQVSELALLKPGQDVITAVDPDKVLDLTDRLDSKGVLDWTAPWGRWKLVRYGHISTGKKIHPASPSAEGYECDKMSREAVRHHFQKGMIGRILALEPKLNGKTVVGVELDSYEGGNSDWTPAFRKEFRKRRGYDLLPWLPAWHGGTVVGSTQQSEKFRHDVKRTVAELCADVYYDEAAAFCRARKVKLYTEAYGTPLWCPLTNAGRADVPEAEFWLSGTFGCNTSLVRLMASAAHTTGKNIVTAESFTHAPKRDPWWITPYDMKALGDNAYCMGLNHTILTEASLQFWQDRMKPGMTFDAWGTPFSVNQTWWAPGRAWMEYQARCHYLLQQGSFVADILVLSPFPAKGANIWGLPVGPHKNYNYDLCSEEIFLKHVRSKKGRIVVGDMEYRVLQLANSAELRPQIVAKLAELVDDGAVVVGQKPVCSPGLEGGEKSDRTVAKLAGTLWAGSSAKRNGQGSAIEGQSADALLKEMDVLPDVEALADIMWIHRRSETADIYFLSNQKAENIATSVIFRVSGRQAELWDAVTGEIRVLPECKETCDGRTDVCLQFVPHQSWFVVFKKQAQGDKGTHASSRDFAGEAEAQRKRNMPELRQVAELGGAWDVQFDAKWFYPDNGTGGKVRFEQLADWTTRPEPAIKYYSGTAVYRKSFDLELTTQNPGLKTFLELGSVNKLAEVILNGQTLGIAWCPPWRVRVPAGLLKSKGNALEIKVTNTWVNRLIGDEQEPDDCEWSEPYPNPAFSRTNPNTRSLLKEPQWLADNTPRPSKGRRTFVTYKHLTANDALQESGLLGPVRMMVEE
jgi:hypothetical protein